MLVRSRLLWERGDQQHRTKFNGTVPVTGCVSGRVVTFVRMDHGPRRDLEVAEYATRT